jgi:hypothetical protein
MRARRSRGGRPRKEHTGPDLGTPELRAHQLALIGGAASGADPALSASPLGRLLALGLITAEEHRCALVYAWLYRRATGWTPPGAARIYSGTMVAGLRSTALGSDASQRVGPDEDRPAVQRRFRAAKNRLLAAGRQVCDATENLVVFEMTPEFLLAGGDGTVTGSVRRRSAQLRAIRDGLGILAACFGAGADRAGNMATHRYASLMQGTKRSRR